MDHFDDFNTGEKPEDTSKPKGFALRVPEDLLQPREEAEPVPAAMEPLFAENSTNAEPAKPPVEEPEPQKEALEQHIKVKKTGGKGFTRAISIAAVLAILIGCCFATGWIVDSRWKNTAHQMQNSFDEQLTALSNRFNDKLGVLQDQLENTNTVIRPSDGSSVVYGDQIPGLVYARNVAGVVQVSCEVTANYYGQISSGTSSGSGFIIAENGYVVTNFHVVEGATSISFTTEDNTVYQAQLVGYDETNDIALLKAEASGLKAVKLGSSKSLAVGDQVVAIGYPLSAQDATLTVGYISAKNRDVNTSGIAINMLQTDAAINSGNSGGPLFNMNGEVIGITTAKYSGTTASGASIEGIGFAIPIDDVTAILSDLMTYGYVNSAYLGVMVRDMTETEVAGAKLYGFPVGVYVVETTEGYCAKKAGVQEKDIIVELGGYAVENMTDLTRALRKFQGGDQTTITVFRGGKEVVLNITLDNKPKPAQQPDSSQPQFPGNMPSEGSYEEWYDYFFGDGEE